MRLSRKMFFFAIIIGFMAASTLLFQKSGQSAGKDLGTQEVYGDVRNFTLKNTAGEPVQLVAELKSHKAVLINFWATWCPPCREEIPGLIELQKKYGGEAFTVLGIDVGESQTKVSKFIERVGINYPVILDEEQSVAEMYHVVGIPTSFLVSSKGKILGEYHSYSKDLTAGVEKAIK